MLLKKIFINWPIALLLCNGYIHSTSDEIEINKQLQNLYQIKPTELSIKDTKTTFFEEYKNIQALNEILKFILSTNLSPYIDENQKNNILMTKHTLYIDFFNKILMMEKYLKAQLFLLKYKTIQLKKQTEQLTSYALYIKDTQKTLKTQQQHLFLKGKLILEEIERDDFTLKEPKNLQIQFNKIFIKYMDYKIEAENFEIKNYIYNTIDHPTYIYEKKLSKSNNEKNSNIIKYCSMIIVISAISMLTYYLWITQTTEILNNSKIETQCI